MGIKDLKADAGTRGMSVDDLLDGLQPSLREHLIHVMSARGLDGKHLLSAAAIVRACEDDGYLVTKWSIRTWRERNNADR